MPTKLLCPVGGFCAGPGVAQKNSALEQVAFKNERAGTMNTDCTIEQALISEDGPFPNNPLLPLMHYVRAFKPSGSDLASDIEKCFNSNGWPAAWRNGVYSYHHYHSEAHEALGVYRGWADIQLGGPNAPVFKVEAGDAVVLPAGTAHKLVDASPDFAVVGAYPPGQHPDMCYGKPVERPGADERIARVPMPATDPVTGAQGGLLDTWEERTP